MGLFKTSISCIIHPKSGALFVKQVAVPSTSAHPRMWLTVRLDYPRGLLAGFSRARPTIGRVVVNCGGGTVSGGRCKKFVHVDPGSARKYMHTLPAIGSCQYIAHCALVNCNGPGDSAIRNYATSIHSALHVGTTYLSSCIWCATP